MLCDLSERPTEPVSPLHSSRHSRQEHVPAIPSNSPEHHHRHHHQRIIMSTTMRTTLQTVPESLPADHVTNASGNTAATNTAPAEAKPHVHTNSANLKTSCRTSTKVSVLVLVYCYCFGTYVSSSLLYIWSPPICIFWSPHACGKIQKRRIARVHIRFGYKYMRIPRSPRCVRCSGCADQRCRFGIGRFGFMHVQ